jgi:phosphoserine phosphatase RsbU/P
MPGRTGLPRSGASTLKRELAQREAELAIVNSVHQGLARRLDTQSIYDLVGDKIRDVFGAQVVMISPYDPQTNTIQHRYAIEAGQRVYSPGPHPPGGFRARIIESRLPLLVNRGVAELAARFGQPTLPGTKTPKSWLGVPMVVDDRVTGVLSLQNVDQEGMFGESDVRLLQTIAASMSVALENARLWELEELYRKALEREFEIGREIQAGFLPGILPQPRGWETAASLLPAREVAGDFYDVFELPGERLGLVIGDVCDKGLGAALFMTLFRSLLRAVSNIGFYARTASGYGDTTAERLTSAMSLTNNYIAETHGHTGMFATVFFGILDTRTGVLAYANAGHLPPLVTDPNGVKGRLTRTGPAVGVMSDADYVIRDVSLEPGDLFFAYTDGLTDTANPAGEYFSQKGLISLCAGGRSLGALLEQIRTEVEDFAGGAKQSDDIAMLAVRRSKRSGA